MAPPSTGLRRPPRCCLHKHQRGPAPVQAAANPRIESQLSEPVAVTRSTVCLGRPFLPPKRTETLHPEDAIQNLDRTFGQPNSGGDLNAAGRPLWAHKLMRCSRSEGSLSPWESSQKTRFLQQTSIGTCTGNLPILESCARMRPSQF